MRRANDGGLYKDENGLPFGINLGADFCAEHEWGIAKLRQSFGIKEGNLGIESRRVQQVKLVPKDDYENYLFQQISDKETIISYTRPKYLEHEKKQELSNYGDTDLACAWSDSDFAIRIQNRNTELKDFLKILWEAFQKQDVAIGLGKPVGYENNPFCNSGLFFLVISRTPKLIIDTMLQKDKDWQDLKSAEKATGIHDLLRKAGKQWIYLGADRYTNKSIKELSFWLNPVDQQIYRAGWYSLGDLKMWAENKGPVMKKREVRS